MYGVEVLYAKIILGRKYRNKREHSLTFRNALPIEMYLQNYDGWKDSVELLNLNRV